VRKTCGWISLSRLTYSYGSLDRFCGVMEFWEEFQPLRVSSVHEHRYGSSQLHEELPK
jgi:hypothetical protein